MFPASKQINEMNLKKQTNKQANKLQIDLLIKLIECQNDGQNNILERQRWKEQNKKKIAGVYCKTIRIFMNVSFNVIKTM